MAALSSFVLKSCSPITIARYSALRSSRVAITKKPIAFTRFVRFKSTQAADLALKFAERFKDDVGEREKRIIGKWLLGCSGMVFGAVVLGGVTRLTGSGLSMVDWHFFKELPPFSQSQWQKEFEKYQQFPEYKIKNKEMTLQEFKFIWWMEYSHRQWGRFIGAVFFLPSMYFLYKGYFPKEMKVRLSIMAGLLTVQGLLGWYMVQSGLRENPESTREPHVSQYRLAAHLGTAFVLYFLFLYNGLHYAFPAKEMPITPQMIKFRKMIHITKGLALLTAISGAFVAGLQAGLIYNTFPKMADMWIPHEILFLRPRYKNFTENPVTAQFDHRILGLSTVAMSTAVWALSRGGPLNKRTRLACTCMGAMGAAQVGLGIATLLLFVPTHLAALHQSGSLVLLSFAIWASHEMRHVKLPKAI